MNIRGLFSMQAKLFRGFASKMQAGHTKNTKDSAGRRLGVKKLGSNEVQPNDIIARQRGLKWHPGDNTYLGKDHTIHSKIEGFVYFERSQRAFHLNKKKFIIHVIPKESANRVRRPPPYAYHPELWPDRAVNNPEPYQLKLSHPTPRPVPRMTTLGRGTIAETPKYRQFISVTESMAPLREQVPTVSDQIIGRVSNKISTLVSKDIVIGFEKDFSNSARKKDIVLV